MYCFWLTHKRKLLIAILKKSIGCKTFFLIVPLLFLIWFLSALIIMWETFQGQTFFTMVFFIEIVAIMWPSTYSSVAKYLASGRVIGTQKLLHSCLPTSLCSLILKIFIGNNNKYAQRGVSKVLFTDRCRWQNFRPSLLLSLNSCVESIYKTQKTKTNVLPSATIGEFYFSIFAASWNTNKC